MPRPSPETGSNRSWSWWGIKHLGRPRDMAMRGDGQSLLLTVSVPPLSPTAVPRAGLSRTRQIHSGHVCHHHIHHLNKEASVSVGKMPRSVGFRASGVPFLLPGVGRLSPSPLSCLPRLGLVEAPLLAISTDGDDCHLGSATPRPTAKPTTHSPWSTEGLCCHFGTLGSLPFFQDCCSCSSRLASIHFCASSSSLNYGTGLFK